jgi:hypothetical protein
VLNDHRWVLAARNWKQNCEAQNVFAHRMQDYVFVFIAWFAVSDDNQTGNVLLN